MTEHKTSKKVLIKKFGLLSRQVAHAISQSAMCLIGVFLAITGFLLLTALEARPIEVWSIGDLQPLYIRLMFISAFLCFATGKKYQVQVTRIHQQGYRTVRKKITRGTAQVVWPDIVKAGKDAKKKDN
ncbi:MAG: hypothetical protein ACK5MN_00480 [Lachnospiraceae bacterium]